MIINWLHPNNAGVPLIYFPFNYLKSLRMWIQNLKALLMWSIFLLNMNNNIIVFNFQIILWHIS